MHYQNFALKDKVEETLRSQVAEGELVPVEWSEWVAPIVIVHKKDGGIRICKTSRFQSTQ